MLELQNLCQLAQSISSAVYRRTRSDSTTTSQQGHRKERPHSRLSALLRARAAFASQVCRARLPLVGEPAYLTFGP